MADVPPDDVLVVDANPVAVHSDPGPGAQAVVTGIGYEELLGEPLQPGRAHHVVAVLVGHDGARWLPATLATLSRISRVPDVVIGVDTGSTDRTPDLLRKALGEDRTVTLPRETGFGAAVAVGVAKADGAAPAVGTPVSWVWVLHDDVAVEPDSLAELLRAADDSPTAAILGPKVLGWHNRRLLREVGVSIGRSGRRETGLERFEQDQGQYDGTRDVLSVSSAGMLIRRDVWDELHGFDPRLTFFRDDVDLGWRAREAGHRVLVVPAAVIHHVEAASVGRRPLASGWSAARRDRRSALAVLLAHAPLWRLPFAALRLVLGSLMRALGWLVAKDPRAAGDELAAIAAAVVDVPGVLASRKSVRRSGSRVDRGDARRYLTGASTWWRHVRDGFGEVRRRLLGGSPTPDLDAASRLNDADDLVASEAWFDDSGGLVQARRVLRIPGVVIGLLLLLACAGWWVRSSQLFGSGLLSGGALLPTPDGAGELWASYRAGWHDIGPGSVVPQAPYVAVLAGLSTLLAGKAWLAIDVLVLLAPVLAGTSAYLCLRGVFRSPYPRWWASLAYALLPAVTGAMAGGRLGTIGLAITLPPLARSIGYLVRSVEPGSQRGWRAVWATALLLALATAFVPAIWPFALGLSVIGIASGIRSTGGVLKIGAALLTPLVLLLPWSAHLIAHPSLWLTEPGLPGPVDSGLRSWSIANLHPGGPGMPPWWATAGIVAAAAVALWRPYRRRAVAAAWLVALLALAWGVLALVVEPTPAWSLAPITAWAGPATLVMGAALIVAAGIAADGARSAVRRAAFGWRQPVIAMLAGFAVLAPIACGAWLALRLESPVARNPITELPAFVAADLAGPSAPRVLVLSAATSNVSWTLIGREAVVLGDADVRPDAASIAPLAPSVRDLVAGRGGAEVQRLGDYAVRYVVLTAKTIDLLSPSGIAARLDSQPGLRKLSREGNTALWRVTDAAARVSTLSPAVVAAEERGEPVPVVRGGESGSAASLSASGQVPASARRVDIAGPYDSGWKVSLDGAIVAAQQKDDATAPMSFPVPGSGALTVTRDESTRSGWLWAQGIGIALVLVLVAPSRRRPGLDDDELDSGDAESAAYLDPRGEESVTAGQDADGAREVTSERSIDTAENEPA